MMRSGAGTVAVIALVIAFGQCALPEDGSGLLRVSGSWSGYSSQSETAAKFAMLAGARASVSGGNNKRGFQYLAEKRADILMWSPYPGANLTGELRRVFPAENDWPTVFSVGQFAVYIVVNRYNPVHELTFRQLRGIFSGSMKNWSELGGADGKITVIGELPHSKSQEIVENEIFDPLSFFGSGVAALNSYDQVAAAVAKNANAIGYCLYRQQPVEGVKVVAIAKDDQGPFELPTEENVFAHR